MSNQDPRFEAIFMAALEKKALVDRDAFLDEQCGEDGELRKQLEEMLAAHGQMGSFLEATTHASQPTVAEKSGMQIGPYKLMEKIGEGGMGVVYVAEQRTPVRRRVALKIIKAGMDSREIVARFAAERQALAMMDHPHITRVLDAGETDSGLAYFVMELVKGASITDYCNQHRLSARQRLALFVDVCSAIQHAHLKGVVHRDIKPSNVLVTSHDGKPVVKVIDFGIAKAIDRPLTADTIYTNFTQLVGTPLYMSPEQAGLSSLDIDTRSDIYSLGILLYELLTGTTPFDKDHFKQAAIDEVRRIIREDAPPKPSTRVSSLNPNDSQIGFPIHSDLRKLGNTLRGDLDWITMKALEKDRTRRYETASGFAADIQRYLADEPVLAGPPSTVYRLQKFARRNRVAVSTAAVVFLALCLGVAGTTWGMLWAVSEKDRANKAVLAEAAAREQAEQRADEVRQIASFQERQLRDLDAEQMGSDLRDGLLREVRKRLKRKRRDPDEIDAILANLNVQISRANFTDLALEVLHKNIFQRAVDVIDAEFAGQPTVQSQLLATAGKTLGSLALPEAAQPILERAITIRRLAVAQDDEATLAMMLELARILNETKQEDEAESLILEGLESCRQRLGDQHAVTLSWMYELARLRRSQLKFEAAIGLNRDILAGRRSQLGDDHPDTLAAMVELGDMLINCVAEQGDEAEDLYREALDRKRRILGEAHTETVDLLETVGRVLEHNGKTKEADACYQEALAKGLQLVNDDSIHLEDLERMMGVVRRLGEDRYDVAPIVRRSLELHRQKFGNAHPKTIEAMKSLAKQLKLQGQLFEAEELYDEAILSAQIDLGRGHNYVMSLIANKLSIMLEIEKLDEAMLILQQNSEQRGNNPASLLDGFMETSLLAAIHFFQGRFDEAETSAQEALDKSAFLGPEIRLNPMAMVRVSTLNLLGRVLMEQGKPEEAEKYFAREIQLVRSVFGTDESSLAIVGRTILTQGKFAQAESMARQAVEYAQREFGADSSETRKAYKLWAEALSERDKFEEAAACWRQIVDFDSRVVGDQHWRTANAKEELGRLLMKLGRYEEAEPVFKQCYEARLNRFALEFWRTHVAKSLWAESIAKQGRFKEAEPLAIAAFESMVVDQSLPSDRQQALQRIIQLYEDWDQAEPGENYDQQAIEWSGRIAGE